MNIVFIKDAGRFAWDELTKNTMKWVKLSVRVALTSLGILALMALLGFIGYSLPVYSSSGPGALNKLYLLPCAFVVVALQAFSPIRDFHMDQLTCAFEMIHRCFSCILPLDLLGCPGFASIRLVLLFFGSAVVLVGTYWLLYEMMSVSLVVMRNTLDVLNGNQMRLFHNRVKSHLFIWGLLVYFLIIMLGMILLIIPGIIFAFRCVFFLFVMVDEKSGLRNSFRKSWAMTKGHALMLIILGLLNNLIVMIPGMLLLLSIFPFTQLFYGALYARLKHRPPEVIVEEIE